MMNANNSRSSYNDPAFKPFQSGCSLCYPSTDYQFTNNMQGGSNQKLISNLPGKNLYKTTNYSVPMNKLTKDNYGISFNTSGGAKNSKNSLEKKVSHMMKYVNKRGGSEHEMMHSEEHSSMMKTGGKKTQRGRSTSRSRSSSRNRSLNKKGGMGKEMMPSEEHSSMMKTGGKKTRRGRSASRSRSSSRSHSLNKKGGKKNQRGNSASRSRSSSRNRSLNKKGGKKTSNGRSNSRSRSSSRQRKLKGGEETMGATGMPSQFFNANAKLMGYPYNSGMGAKTAYGPANPKDVGMGLLAPNTTSKASTANPATSMKTGGTKKKNKKQSGKGFPIPTLSQAPIDVVQVNVDKGINDVQSFLKDLKKDYVKSVQKAASIKIGNQRLIQGGAKNKKNKKKVKKTDKKSEKKVMKKDKKKKKGGNGSDFISTFNSRGPSNAPDNYWGVNGEKWFRQFNKSADYIPNSQLAKAATPKLLAGPMNEKVVGYNSFESTFSPIRGGKKTKTKKKVVKKEKVIKKKKIAKKEKVIKKKKIAKKDTKKSSKKEKNLLRKNKLK
jgi:hypothetical protein